jgi:rare lipoprotein A
MIRSTCFLPLVATTALLAAAPGRAHAQGSGWEEIGEASWYGDGFAGQRTSSGERFDPARMTAAHTTLPLGSRVRVTRQDTGASVVVRVTDRLPRHGVRVIDLSRGAASRLSMVSRGTAWVTLTPAGPNDLEEVAEAPEGRLRHRAGH